MRDLLQEIWSTLRQNKLRTALTGFAVAWGIFMLIALLGAGNGVLNALLNNSGRLENSISIWAGYTSKAYGGYDRWRPIRLDERDIDALDAEPFGTYVDDISPIVSKNGTLTYGNKSINCSLKGVTPAFKEIEKEQLVAGRFVNRRDLEEKRRTIVLGSKEAAMLLDSDDNPARLIGEQLRISGFTWQVVGIYKSDETEGSDSATLFAPYSTVNLIYQNGRYISQVVLSFHGLETDAQNEAFEKDYTRSVNYRHGADPTDDNTLYIWNRYTSNKQMNKAIRIIRTALWILGLFTLISGIVGVSNIMLITVKERTHEFGIRKAIGANPRSILRLIIAEAIAITTFFGYIGMLAGLAANQIMDATLAQKPIDAGIIQITMFLNPTVGIDVAVKATVVLIVAGTLAGLVPAWKAARVRPIEALRAD